MNRQSLKDHLISVFTGAVSSGVGGAVVFATADAVAPAGGAGAAAVVFAAAVSSGVGVVSDAAGKLCDEFKSVSFVLSMIPGVLGGAVLAVNLLSADVRHDEKTSTLEDHQSAVTEFTSADHIQQLGFSAFVTGFNHFRA